MSALRLLALLLLLPGRAAWAAPADTLKPARRLAPRVPVEVTRVKSLANTRNDTLQIEDHVQLTVTGLAQALAEYKREPQELRLFIDDVAFPMEPEINSVDTIHSADTATVRFLLRRDASTEPIWQLFYEVRRKKLSHSPARIGIGFENGRLGHAYQPPPGHPILLELVREREFNVGLGLVAALLLGLLYLSWHSNLIRSDTVRGDLAQSRKPHQIPMTGAAYTSVPFSLSKVQLAFWTFLILSAYLLCYLVTGELAALPASLLGLLGISLGSTLFSRSLTDNQVASVGPLKVTSKTQGFWRDLLAEDNRFSLARIQFLLFNLLVGFYFVRHVWKHWNLPDLDSGLLGLISVSATGFLFGKSQENKPPDPKPGDRGPDGSSSGDGGPGGSSNTSADGTKADGNTSSNGPGSSTNSPVIPATPAGSAPASLTGEAAPAAG